MTLDMKQVEASFIACHEEKEFKEFLQEKQDNYTILYSRPFNEVRARDLISKLIDKYGPEINVFAKQEKNGKTTTKQPIDKTLPFTH